MSKIIIWIDDSDVKMENVAEGMISELWNLGINSRLIFLGDADGLSESFTEDGTVEFVRDLFDSYAADKESGTLDESERDHLDCVRKFVEQDTIPLIKDISQPLAALINSWKNPSNADNFRTNWLNKNVELDNTLSVEAVFTELGDMADSVFALDIVLLAGDEEKLNTEQDNCLPILSLELYHHIKEVLGKKCILYSKYTFLHRLQENWKYLYKERYGEKVVIFPRDGLSSGSINNIIIEAFKSEVSD